MEIRKTLNDRPALSANIAGAVCLLAILLVVWQQFGKRAGANAANEGKTFFSDDDGKTWFIDDDSKLPPFDHNGKTAYRAAVYRCLGGKPFVAFLEKYSDSQLAELEKEKMAMAQHNPNAARRRGLPADIPMDVKKPGESEWFSATASGGKSDASGYQRVTNAVCPDGSSQVTTVLPSAPDAQ